MTSTGAISALVVAIAWPDAPRAALCEKRTPDLRLHLQDGAAKKMLVVMAMFLVTLDGCRSKEMAMDTDALKDFGTRYTAAWCSQNASRVASFFSENGSLKINDGNPSVGRIAITAAAQSFMTAFPDMVVTMNEINGHGGHAVYRWTLTGTNTGPGGKGQAVRISGYEEWTMGADGLIAESGGHFDEADYLRQLSEGTAGR